MPNQIAVSAWYMEKVNPARNEHKQYTVLIAENHVVLTHWGRIGSKGQHTLTKLSTASEAEALGMRQVYSKQTGGYQVKVDAFKFLLDEEVILEACRRDIHVNLIAAYEKALAAGDSAGDRAVVLKHYDDFARKAHDLLNGANNKPFEEVHAEFETLKEAWGVINDKHDEVAVVMSLAEQTLTQRLMSGAL